MDALDLNDNSPAANIYGFKIRRCPGPRPKLRVQAGIIVTELRQYRDPGMVGAFDARVSLFRLLGHGESEDEAIEMAKQNPNGRNGR